VEYPWRCGAWETPYGAGTVVGVCSAVMAEEAPWVALVLDRLVNEGGKFGRKVLRAKNGQGVREAEE